MTKTITIAFALLGIYTASSYASPFAPVREDQVPSGMAYSVKQPAVEYSGMFSGKHVAILASHGVEEAEITYPYEYLVARGAQVDVVVPSWAAEGVVAVRFLKPTLWVQGSTTFEQAQKQHYDILVVTGGAWNAQVVRSDGSALKLISNHYRQGLPVAAICAGSSVLIDAGLARGQVLTGSPVVAVDLINAGAKYTDAALVRGDRLATSRSPNDLPEFVGGIRQLLLGH